MSVWFNDAFEPIETCAVPWSVVWLDPARNLFAIVDTIDLAWCQQWSWAPVGSKSGPGRIEKWYARRSISIDTGPDGRRKASRCTLNIWLHKEILLRAKGPPPSKAATIGDHRNGNSLDCRRFNLRWSTSSENRRNLYGSASHQLHLGFDKVMPRHLTTPRFEEQGEMADV
jgi:hypothetical protein